MNEMYISSHQENKKKTFLENCLSLLLLNRDTKGERRGKITHRSLVERNLLLYMRVCSVHQEALEIYIYIYI